MTRPHPALRPRARILIVDDHPVVRYGLAQLLSHEADLEVCGEAASAQEALGLVESNCPDLAVIDISLAGTSGLELIKQIRSRWPELKLLVSSMHDERLFAERSLRAGAAGYVHKQEAVTEIVGAIRRVLGGKVYLSAKMTDRLLTRMAGAGRAGAVSVEGLSDRELEVFSLLGDGQTTQQIALRLGLSVKTIETHREHIKGKLGLRNSNELIQRAARWRLGEG